MVDLIGGLVKEKRPNEDIDYDDDIKYITAILSGTDVMSSMKNVRRLSVIMMMLLTLPFPF